MPGLRHFALWTLAFAAASAVAPDARGGGPYDKATRSFALNYIYLDLPSGQLDEQAVLSASSTSRPSAEQQRNVTLFLGKVSDVFSKVTSGRAKIGKLGEVQDVKKADVVISLTGKVTPLAGGAWAASLGWKQGGSLNLYYQDLVDEKSEDVVETVVHELCHYFMGLPDEYPQGGGAAPLCPLNAPGGARCLMDNFHYGWSGGLCTHANHNPSAASRNVFPAARSCQELVDQFFDNLGVKADPGATAGAEPTGPVASIPSGLKEQVLGKARDELTRIRARRGRGLFTPEDRSRIKSFVLGALVDFFKTAGGAKPTNIGGYAEKLASQLILTSVGVPPGLSLIEPFLRAEAARLARSITDPNGKATAIKTGLINSAVAKLKQTVGASPTLAGEDVEFLAALASQAASGQDVKSPESAAQLQLELQREMADTLLALANEVNVPGAGARRDSLRRIYAGLEQAGAIPTRTLDHRFGLRRTVIIEPPVLMRPLSAFGLDNAETQGFSRQDPRSNYNRVRRLALWEFSRLVDRSRINLLTASKFTAGAGGVAQGLVDPGLFGFDPSNLEAVFEYDRQQGLSATVAGRVDPGLADAVLDARKARIAQSLALIQDAIERDQIENIVLLVPPMGLPDELGEALRPLREKYLDKTDLRLDIALVGPAKIPAELRDLVARTRGSILTVADVDEVGAVAQRLAGEQTQGTWVMIPQQDRLVVTPPAKAPPPIPHPKVTYNAAEDPYYPLTPIFERLKGNRRTHTVKTDAGSTSQVVLKPFYVDPATQYQLVIGLSQPLAIAGLTQPMGVELAAPSPGPLPWAQVFPRSGKNLEDFPDPTLKLISGAIRDPQAIQTNEGPNGPVLTFASTPELKLDLGKSTSQVLVFTLPATTKGGIEPGFYTPMLMLKDGNFHDAIWSASNPAGQAKISDAKQARRDAEDATDRQRQAELDAAARAQAVRDAEDAAAKAHASADAIRKSAAGAAATKAADDVATAADKALTDAKAAAEKARADSVTAGESAKGLAQKATDSGLPPGQVSRSPDPHPYRNNTINFTFSVGTPTSKAQLAANLVQDVSEDTSSVGHGTVTGN
ncbi:MAG TPA: hypothetical protein VGH33_09165 [Isosphaeraceae bacterium]